MRVENSCVYVRDRAGSAKPRGFFGVAEAAVTRRAIAREARGAKGDSQELRGEPGLIT